MATLKSQYADIELQLGAKEYECEVLFNYTPAIQGSQFVPSVLEEFEVNSVQVINTYINGQEFYLDDDLISFLEDEIIEKIKEQKEV